MLRPETRGPLPTDADINRLAEYPGIVGQTMQAAQLAADMEREVPCQSVFGCDREADWHGRARCPRCHAHMFRRGASVFLCDPHRTGWLARLAAARSLRCPLLRRKSPAR